MLPLTLPPAVVHLLALGAAQEAKFFAHRASANLAAPFLKSFVFGLRIDLTIFVSHLVFEAV